MTVLFGIIIVERKQANMLKLNPTLYAVVVLLIASLACASPTISISTPDSGSVGTIIAQTAAAALTQTAQALPSTPTVTELPTLTPTPTLSPTPTFTATPLIPQLRVSVATNCRLGPGDIYERVGVLSVDEVVEVFGRDSTLKYWYIRNPEGAPEYCWVWGEYAELAGNIFALPVYTPPAIAFDVTSGGIQRCTATGWWIGILLRNQSKATFKSVTISLKDDTKGTIVSMSADGFTDKNGCSDSVSKPTLDPGTEWTVSLPPFTYDPSGHNLIATITLCVEVSLGGTCGSQVVSFKP